MGNIIETSYISIMTIIITVLKWFCNGVTRKWWDWRSTPKEHERSAWVVPLRGLTGCGSFFYFCVHCCMHACPESTLVSVYMSEVAYWPRWHFHWVLTTACASTVWSSLCLIWKTSVLFWQISYALSHINLCTEWITLTYLFGDSDLRKHDTTKGNICEFHCLILT